MIKVLLALVMVGLATQNAQAQLKRAAEPVKKGEAAKIEEKARETGKSTTIEATRTRPEEKASARVLKFPTTESKQNSASDAVKASTETAAAVRAKAANAEKLPPNRQEIMERILRVASSRLGSNSVVAGTPEFKVLESYADGRVAEELAGKGVSIDVRKLVELIDEVRKDSKGDFSGIAENLRAGVDMFKKGDVASVKEGLVKQIQNLRKGQDPEEVRKEVERCAAL